MCLSYVRPAARILVAAIIALILVAACGQTEPTSTPAPPAATATLAPAATDPPPAPTSAPVLSPTTVPPTLVPTPAPENAAPVISGLDDQTVPDDEGFPHIALDDYVSDADHADEEIAWSRAGNDELSARIVQTRRELMVRAPDADWRGSETIRLEACDPDGLCDAVELVFAVLEENDAPVISLGGQAVLPGESFRQIVLDECVSDVDSPLDEITWSFEGNVELGVSMAEGVLTVDAPDAGWSGSETLRLEACDAGGACGSTELVFTVADESDLLITYISNEGFLIVGGGKKVLVDALDRDEVSPATLALMENAAPPFDGVDLVLTTHSHFDHFDAGVARRHLENNPDAVFVSTEAVLRALQREADFDEIAERVVAIQLAENESVQQTVNDVELQIIDLPHGPGRREINLGFIITLGEYKLLHMGDTDPGTVDVPFLDVYDLPSKGIDVAFVPHFILLNPSSHPIVLRGIQPRYVVPMHFFHTTPAVNYDLMETYFPDAIILNEEMASWVMPRGE